MNSRFTKLSTRSKKLSSHQYSDSDNDSDTDSDFKLRISHKRLKSDTLHETNGTNSGKEKTPDLNETNEINSIEPSRIPTVTTIPSKQKSKQKSKQISKQISKQKKIDNVYDELNDNESINNEEDDNNMDIADSDDGSYLKEHIQCTQSTSSSAAKQKPLSKTQRYNRNQRIKKAEVQVDKEQFDAALQSLALQNAVEQELPFHPIPNDRRPKPKRIFKKPTKLQDPNHWCLPDPLPWCPPEKLLHRPWNSSKLPKDPKPKKVRSPPFDYTIPPKRKNVSKLKKFNIPSAFSPIHGFDDGRRRISC